MLSGDQCNGLFVDTPFNISIYSNVSLNQFIKFQIYLSSSSSTCLILQGVLMEQTTLKRLEYK